MSLSPQWLDELRARVALSGVIGRTTRLTRAGREFKACCPFHNEKTPSFTVNDEKGFYHCFGCGAHGDVIRWMTDQRGLTFMDAVKELAGEAGMEVPAPDPRAARAAEQRDTLHDVMAAAQIWFVDNLNGTEGATARAYLARRGIDPHTMARFGFGLAPDDRQSLKTALARFPEELLIEAGLRIQVESPDSTSKREPYDRFRGRLMLPIEDARGRIIGFGGRILDGAPSDAPKYLNSPDTPLFDKGRTLYNVHRAGPAARQNGRLIVVEGYMDAIALAAAGIEEVVAPLGTALTERQIELLWRLVEVPVLCFDGDTAGQRAAMRAVGRALPLLRPAHSLSIVRLPAGLDPDDLVKRDGRAGFEAALAGAGSLLDTLWVHERDAAPLKSPEDKAGLKARLLERVETIADRDIQALYRRELLDRFSAFAFPRRENIQTRGRWQAPPAPPTQAALRRLRRPAGELRDALAAAVVAGLVLWPAQIRRHAEVLARAGIDDQRIGALLDALDLGHALESKAVATIFAEQGLSLPLPEDYASLRFGFLAPDVRADQAAEELAQAVALLVERPALDAALAAATERFEIELSEGAFAEQQRLLKRKLEFEARLRQMATARAAGPTGAAPTTMAE